MAVTTSKHTRHTGRASAKGGQVKCTHTLTGNVHAQGFANITVALAVGLQQTVRRNEVVTSRTIAHSMPDALHTVSAVRSASHEATVRCTLAGWT